MPTWTLVPHGHAGIWYWFKGVSRSPWYSQVEVRRQASGQSWRDLIAAVTPELFASLSP